MCINTPFVALWPTGVIGLTSYTALTTSFVASSLNATPQIVGVTHFRGNDGRPTTGPGHPDTVRLTEILRTHGICMLNTWQPMQPPTFQGSKGTGSRIDFLGTRLRQVDSEAKQCSAIPTCPLVGMQTQGHFPLVGSIPLSWRPCGGRALTSVSYECKLRGRAAALMQTAQWDRFVEASTAIIDRTSWNRTGLTVQLVQDHFAAASWKECSWDCTAGLSTQKWAIFRTIKGTTGCSLQDCFRVWHLVIRHKQLDRRIKQFSQQARQAKVEMLVNEANHAASRHDLLNLHRIVRQIAPKTRPERLQLRGPNGELLTPLEEFCHLKHFVSTQWEGPPLQLVASVAPGVPFEQSELALALSKAKVMKSNSPGTVPNLCLRSCANVLASKLMPLLQHWWNQSPPFAPGCWKAAHLFFAPKTFKTTHQSLEPAPPLRFRMPLVKR